MVPGEPIREAVLATLISMGAVPERAGKPLVGRLAGLWSARVGNYRVLSTIESGGVIVRAIRHHAVAYRGKRRWAHATPRRPSGVVAERGLRPSGS